MGCSESSCKLAGGEVIDFNVEPKSTGIRLACTSNSAEPVIADTPARPHCPRQTWQTSSAEGNMAGPTAQAEPSIAVREVPLQTCEILLHRKKGERVGAVLGNAKAGAAVISIEEGGILDKWNKSFPDRMVHPGFIISEVNGKSGYWDIMQQMRKLGRLAIKVDQPSADASADWFERISEMAKCAEKQTTSDAFMLRLQPQGAEDACSSELCSLPFAKAGDCGVDQCAICLEDVAPHQALVQLPCSHAFHPLCAGRWLEQTMKMASSKKQSCPMCCRKLILSVEGSACCTPER